MASSDLRLIEKICWHYYCEGLTQQEIASLLGLSRIRVIKLLDEGRSRGVVSFHINRVDNALSEVESALVKAYPLEDAYVIPSPADKKSLPSVLAKAATAYVNERISRDSVINIGYGRTLSLAVNYLASSVESTVTAISLTGGVNNYLPNTLSEIFRLKLYLCPSPLILSDKPLRDAMLRQHDVMWISKMIKTATMSLFSVGGLGEDATLITQGLFEKRDFVYLRQKGAVGDILGHFIDRNGRIVDEENDSLMVTTGLDTLKELPGTIMVAGGAEKEAVMRSAINARLARILVTDESTARSLLKNQ